MFYSVSLNAVESEPNHYKDSEILHNKLEKLKKSIKEWIQTKAPWEERKKDHYRSQHKVKDQII